MSTSPVDAAGFLDEVVRPYGRGEGGALPMSAHDARAVMPPATSALRDLGYVAAELPVLDAARCTACMECVVVCPDAALLARVVPEAECEALLGDVERADLSEALCGRFARARRLAPRHKPPTVPQIKKDQGAGNASRMRN